MKGILVLLIAGAVAAGSYCAYFECATRSGQAMLAKPEGGMEWLRHEFHLSEAQFERIKALHEAFKPRCGVMCAHIAAANEKLARALAANQGVTPEVETALKE